MARKTLLVDPQIVERRLYGFIRLRVRQWCEPRRQSVSQVIGGACAQAHHVAAAGQANPLPGDVLVVGMTTNAGRRIHNRLQSDMRNYGCVDDVQPDSDRGLAAAHGEAVAEACARGSAQMGYCVHSVCQIQQISVREPTPCIRKAGLLDKRCRPTACTIVRLNPALVWTNRQGPWTVTFSLVWRVFISTKWRCRALKRRHRWDPCVRCRKTAIPDLQRVPMAARTALTTAGFVTSLCSVMNSSALRLYTLPGRKR